MKTKINKKKSLYQQGYEYGKLKRLFDECEAEYKQGKKDGYNENPIRRN